MSQRMKAIMNYEQHPPRCGSCGQFSPPQKASAPLVVGGKEMGPALRHVPCHCKKGGFAVSPAGICDDWSHKTTGEVLAP